MLRGLVHSRPAAGGQIQLDILSSPDLLSQSANHNFMLGLLQEDLTSMGEHVDLLLTLID